MYDLKKTPRRFLVALAALLLLFPEPLLCTDNGAMIACAGYYRYLQGFRSDLELNAYPSLKLGDESIYVKGEC